VTLYRSHDRGTWFVKRVLLRILVRRATGLSERRRAADLERVLLQLAEHGRGDLILAFSTGHVSGPELLASVERYGLTYRLTTETALKVRRAMYDWLRTVKLAHKTRADYRWNLGALVGKLPALDRALRTKEQRALARGPDLHELPRLLARYARRALPSQFVQVKAACQAFVRDTVPDGRESGLWRQLRAIEGAPRPRRQVQGGLSPARAREVAERLGPTLGQMWWTLCCTGMETKEYWRRKGWDVRADRILIHGTKTLRFHEARDRAVPRLVTPVRTALGIRAFRTHLRAVGDALGILDLTPYVGRRTFAHFLEEAGIVKSRREAYLGHSPKDELAKYEEHDVGPYLAGDAAAVRKVIGPEPRYMRALA